MASASRYVVTVCQKTENPVLVLFSGDPAKVFASYDHLRQNSDLLDEISIYFQKIAEYYGEEMVNMHTEQDFWRDYPLKNQPFAFPWEAEYHQRVIEQVRAEVRDEERKATARTMRDLGLDTALITKITGFTPEEIRTL